jgi:Protein of unknown function (DUF2612)
MSAELIAYLDYYQSLMAAQYRDLPRASAQIRNFVAQAAADAFLYQLADAFNLDTAIGAQLDIIGKYVGVTRIASVPLDTPLFGFWDSTESNPLLQNPYGFYDETGPYSEWLSSLSSSTSSTSLSDGQYIQLLKLKIFLNHTNMTLASIQDFLVTFFPGLISVTDTSLMVLNYFVSVTVSLPESILEQYLPRPMGVSITITYY